MNPILARAFQRTEQNQRFRNTLKAIGCVVDDDARESFIKAQEHGLTLSTASRLLIAGLTWSQMVKLRGEVGERALIEHGIQLAQILSTGVLRP